MEDFNRKTTYVTEKELIEACRRQDRKAQKMLFDRYSPKMFGVCKRYVKRREDAEDVLIDGLYKVLSNLEKYSGTGSFEGWIRKIIVNESLMFLRKTNNFKYTLELNDYDKATQVSAEDDLMAEDILQLLNQLPTGYRTVFNLYVLEGYKHREIAELLGISINTSKSQLILAKKRLREILKTNNYPGVSWAAGASDE